MSLHRRLSDDWIWGLKYRPSNLKDLILPPRIQKQINSAIKAKHIPNFLLSGPAGCGKTSTAVVLCEMLDMEYLYINGSEQTGIDILRTTVRQFITSTNWDDRKKMLIIDESDRCSPQLQDGLKSALEEFSKGCTFIFISNHKNKIIEPLQSRLQTIDFHFTSKELEEMKIIFFKICCDILKTEKIEFNKKVVANLIQKLFPDMRKSLNELQKFAQQDALNDISLINDMSINESEFYKLLKDRKLADLRKYISGIGDAQSFYSKLHDTYFKFIEPKDLPEFIILLNKYCYEANFVADTRINLMAFCVEVAASCSVKDDA